MTDFTACKDTAGAPLVAGAWYCLGFELFAAVDEPAIDWGPIYQFTGAEFVDDDGPVEMLWDPELQMPVSPAAADAYARQS